MIELAAPDRRAKRALVIADNRLALVRAGTRRCWRWNWPAVEAGYDLADRLRDAANSSACWLVRRT